MVCLGLDHLRLLNEQELSLEILNEQPKDTKVNCHSMSTQRDTNVHVHVNVPWCFMIGNLFLNQILHTN